VAQGLRPGPQLFEEQGATVFAILIAMVFANVMFLVIGYLSIPFFSRLVQIKTSVLVPVVIMFAFAGTYVFRSDNFDLLMLVVFGLFGLLARAGKFDVMPMVMGFILGPPMEYAFGQTMAMGNGATMAFMLEERLGAMCVLLAIPVIGWMLWRRMQKVSEG
jgi:putative tricarboxylic transport membrane protein